MDANSSRKKKAVRTPSQPRVKTAEKKQMKERATSPVLSSHDKHGLPLEKQIEREKRRTYVLINEHNRLTDAVKKKEAKLKELHDALEVAKLESGSYKGEDAVKQQIRQLENNREKMKLKITVAEKLQITYQSCRETLQREVHNMQASLDQKERAVALAQAKVEKATKIFQSATSAANLTVGKMVQMPYEWERKRREMNMELHELNAERQELRNMIERVGHRNPSGQSRLRAQGIEEEEEEEEEKDEEEESCDRQWDDSESAMKLIEEQRTIKEQLLIEKEQAEEEIRQRTKTLADLELHYDKLREEHAATATRFEELREHKQAELNQAVDRVKRLQAERKQSQDVLDAVEQGVDNIYFKMSCVPVEGLPNVSTSNSMDKLADIDARVQKLLQKTGTQRPDVSSLDPERVYDLLKERNTEQSRNNKREDTPIDTSELSEEEEECCPTAKDIKRNSIRGRSCQRGAGRGRRDADHTVVVKK